MSTLLLRLEGPLQAWSSQGKLGVRDTEREPTKSGVLGLLGAALGVDRSDDAGLAELARLVMAVRVDRAGSLLHDYHTAGGGTFRGSKKYTVNGTSDCVPTHRYYLQDASFLVGLEGERALLERVARAFDAPRWPLCLGRRSCPLSVFPVVALVDVGLLRAVREAPRAERSDDGALRIVVETPDASEGDPRGDVPLSFGPYERRYGVRYVRTEWLAEKQPEPDGASDSVLVVAKEAHS